eukprot:COSAG02_NODE_20957_length_808_cov_1.118477_1_plen_37_part_01
MWGVEVNGWLPLYAITDSYSILIDAELLVLCCGPPVA